MRWIGQHIWNFISRFRSDVYLDDISDGTVADDKFLGLDANNKIVKEAIAAGLNLANEGNNRVVTSSGGTDLNAESTLTWDGSDFNATSGGTAKPQITFQSIAPNNKPAKLSFYKDRVGTTNDFVGQISFDGKDNSSAAQQYGLIEASIVDATNTDEAGKIEIKVAASNGTSSNLRNFISGTGSNSADDVDVSIGYGTTSETTVAGSLTTEGGIFINNDSYLNIVNTGGYGVRINYTSGTANRTVTFPDAAGTIALTSDITSDGWHGSTTRIKILPRDFVANDIGRPIMIEDDSVGSNELFLFSFSSGDMFAYVPIPTGYKATHVRIYGSDATQDFYVYEGDINSKTIADVATGSTSIGTEKTLGTEVTSDTTNYLIVRVTSNGSTDEIHGGYVTIAAV